MPYLVLCKKSTWFAAKYQKKAQPRYNKILHSWYKPCPYCYYVLLLLIIITVLFLWTSLSEWNKRTRTVARIFFYRGKGDFDPKGRRPRLAGPRAGGGVLGMGQPAHPHHLGDLGSAVSSPNGVQGGASAAKRFSRVLRVHSGFSRQFIVVYCSLKRKNFSLYSSFLEFTGTTA